MTEDLKFLMQRVVSRKFHNVKVNDEILAGVNHVCNQVIHSILYYSFPEIGQQLSNLYASCETPETVLGEYFRMITDPAPFCRQDLLHPVHLCSPQSSPLLVCAD